MRSTNWVRRYVTFVPCLAASLVVLGAAPQADALPLITLSASARGLYGASTGDPVVNPYGVGIGLRAGVTVPFSLYLGGSFDYFFGESETVGAAETSASLLQLMAVAGYDAGLGPLTLRPSLGLGVAESSVEVGSVEASESDFVLSPGAELMIGLGLLAASAELRYNKVFAGEGADADAVVLGVGLGVSF